MIYPAAHAQTTRETDGRRRAYPAAWRVPEAEELPDGGALL